MKTTVVISDPLLARVRRLCQRDHTTLRALIEEGLRAVVKRKGGPKAGRFSLRKISQAGAGLLPDAQGGGWATIRETIYHGRGA